ncbi:MAG: hypothetical protein U0414_11340 [Polyangiaceae bacterium]
MASVTPSDLSSKAAAQAATALPIDAPRVALSFDPLIGEQALLQCKAALLAMDPAQVLIPNCDIIQTAVVSMQLVDVLRSARIAPAFAMLSADVMGDATPERVETLAQTLFFLETRIRTKNATSNEIRVDVELITQGTAVRDRMLRVLAYHFESNPVMKAEVADIRLGAGYVDLASDLARVATHYSTHREILSKDTFQYDAKDEDLARGISREIMSALHATTDNSLSDLRNRCWTKLTRVYAKLKAAGELLFLESPPDLALFPTLRTAVMAITSRSRGSDKTEPAAPDAAPPAPGLAPAPAAPMTPAPAIGVGPGGSPIV